MFRGSVKSNGYALQSPISPSFPLTYVTACHHISTGLYSPWSGHYTNWAGLVPSYRCFRLVFLSTVTIKIQHLWVYEMLYIQLHCSNHVISYLKGMLGPQRCVNWFLVNDQSDAQILFYVFISFCNSLHVWITSCSSSGEANCVNIASGNSHSMLMAEMYAGLKKSS
jgi:hypothetical protein